MKMFGHFMDENSSTVKPFNVNVLFLITERYQKTRSLQILFKEKTKKWLKPMNIINLIKKLIKTHT